MRLTSYLTTFLVAVLLASCGGGGGSPGLSPVPAAAFIVAAPAAVTLQVGLTQQYVIQGGVKPYTVFSTDPAVAVGWLVGENVVSIGTAAAGKATVSVQDAKATKFDIAVTSGSSLAFFTTAPTGLTIAPGALAAQTFKLGGGIPPYKAVSSIPSSLSVVVNGTDVTFTALQLPGSVTVTLTDSSSPPATFTSTVTLGTIPLAVNPSTTTMPIGGTLRAVITGGTPPYRTVILDNCSTNAQIIQGNILQATASLACTGSAITVVDANNQTVSLSLTITAGTVGLQLAPSALTVPESTNTPTLSLLVYGANGPIQVFTTNTARLAPQAPVKNADGTYTIALTGGDTCFTPAVAAVPAVPAVPGKPGVDNSIPPNGTFTDPEDTPPTPFIPAIPAKAAIPASPLGADVPITISVLDATGRTGTTVVTVRDNGLGGPGCN